MKRISWLLIALTLAGCSRSPADDTTEARSAEVDEPAAESTGVAKIPPKRQRPRISKC